MFGIGSNQPGSYFNKGHNAIWISHQWVGEEKELYEVQELISNLEKNQIDTVFVHAGPLQEDGNIDEDRYAYAVDFLDKAKKVSDKIEYQAWLGQLRQKIDLDDPNIRHNAVNQAIIMTQIIGFDGIHYDVEPVWDGDEGFISLLEETREAIPKDKKISVALAEFVPKSFIWLVEKIHTFENYNTEINYLNVAKYADQIVVMVYDTGINHNWVYRRLVKEQTIRTTNLLSDKEVFIAIPLYEDVKEGFNPEIENVENGLYGIIDGLNDIRSEVDNFAGVALYPYWTTDRNEWKSYHDIWLDN